MRESKLFLVVLAMAINFVVSGQMPDTLFVAAAREHSIRSYELATTIQSGLYSGSEYAEPIRTNDSHPYFITEDWQEGDIEYNGQVYRKLPFLFDLSTQRLVSELLNGQPFVLIEDHVRWFTLNGRRFVNIRYMPFGNDLLASGYYEEVYDGRTGVYVYHTKDREERIESSAIEVYFNAKSKYYVLLNGKLVRITSRATLLKAFNDQKPEIRSFIHKQKLKFKRGMLSGTLAAVASYYDTLKSPTE